VNIRSVFIFAAKGPTKTIRRQHSEIYILIGGCVLAMDKETIIFFEQLGFGWVLNNMMLKEIKLNTIRDELIADTSLIKIIENMLAENPNL
jgi:hypothetical protein